MALPASDKMIPSQPIMLDSHARVGELRQVITNNAEDGAAIPGRRSRLHVLQQGVSQ